MNKELKVGDIVVLVEGEYLTNTQNILAKEKHLFEVEKWGNDTINLKSISTNIKVIVYLKNVRHATLKEQYLRTGNSIVIDDMGYLVVGNEVIGLKGGFDTDYFCDNLLTVTDERPITKIFNNQSGKFKNKIDVNHMLTTTLWERERKPKIELTSDEVVILKNIDKKYKYIARDDSGQLTVYEEEPKKDDEYNQYISISDNWNNLYAFCHIFQNITFESGPHLITDLIKENEK